MQNAHGRRRKNISACAVSVLLIVTSALAEASKTCANAEVSKGQLPAGAQFTARSVDAAAEALSHRPYTQDNYTPPAPLGEFGYDEYRNIRFKQDRAIWHRANADHPHITLQFFLASFIHRERVDIEIIEDGISRPLHASRDMFDYGLSNVRVPRSGDFAFSGFRVHGPLNSRSVSDEILAFNGASYFRALGRNHAYGLSARGLSLNTIGPTPEEFPRFSKFWLEKPDSDSRFNMHALLDSPSVVGAYHFVVSPGTPTIIDVSVTLYPRNILGNVGLAPLTSMFLFDSRNHSRFADFRAAVHDSDGLAIAYQTGERLWRPLLNPLTQQASRFDGGRVDGFGLIQRKRKYEDYYDLEAHYQKRPSVWIEPKGDWGPGTVELLELPIGAEWGDNIVAYWRPIEPITPSKPYRFAYRSIWGDDVPLSARRITQTRKGIEGGKLIFVVDYERLSSKAQMSTKPQVKASAGRVSQPILQTDPSTGGLRCFFTFEAGGASTAELKITMVNPDGTADRSTEVWTYRWLDE